MIEELEEKNTGSVVQPYYRGHSQEQIKMELVQIIVFAYIQGCYEKSMRKCM